MVSRDALSAAFLSALRERVPDVVATGLTLRSATHGTVRFTSGNSFASVPMWGGNKRLFEVVTEVVKKHGALKY